MGIATIIARLSEKFDKDEAALLAKYLIDDLPSGIHTEESILDNAIQRLLNDEPLQYITGKAYFLDYIFHVNNNVLIPRPETEELVIWAIEVIRNRDINQVVEVGTGSGCIAISLNDKTEAKITAIDISAEALIVAKQNALKYNCEIDFICQNFLDEEVFMILPSPSLVISNPPYITPDERDSMQHNVLNYEPLDALFAKGPNPFIFYKQLAVYGLFNQSIVMCEINEHYEEEISSIFVATGYNIVEVRNDLQGKPRMLMACYDHEIDN